VFRIGRENSPEGTHLLYMTNHENEPISSVDPQLSSTDSGVGSESISLDNTQEQESLVDTTESGLAEEASEQSALADAQARIADYDDRYKRLFAEFDNYRRRTAKERLEMITTASAEVIKDVLPTLDDIERGLATYHQTGNAEALVNGITLVHKRMLTTLERRGLKAIDTKGQPFDTEMHEAITQIPAPEPALKGFVVDEIEKGYKLGEKVIRFSKVVVGQ
jgi:molecular chaperone GrpE